MTLKGSPKKIKKLQKYANDVKLEPFKTGKAWNHGFSGFKTEAQIHEPKPYFTRSYAYTSLKPAQVGVMAMF